MVEVEKKLQQKESFSSETFHFSNKKIKTVIFYFDFVA